jgi:hypothetical protein
VRERRIFLPVAPNHREVSVMYSVQHVLWRGAMALSLLVVGGVGAGVSEQPREPEAANECGEEIDAQVALRVAPLPHTHFDVVVIRAIHTVDEA